MADTSTSPMLEGSTCTNTTVTTTTARERVPARSRHTQLINFCATRGHVGTAPPHTRASAPRITQPHASLQGDALGCPAFTTPPLTCPPPEALRPRAATLAPHGHWRVPEGRWPLGPVDPERAQGAQLAPGPPPPPPARNLGHHRAHPRPPPPLWAAHSGSPHPRCVGPGWGLALGWGGLPGAGQEGRAHC